MDDVIFEALAHKLRRAVIKLLGERKSMGYSELMNALNVDSPTLAFHLRKLGGLVEKQGDVYVLTELGKKAYGLLLSLDGVEVGGETRENNEFKGEPLVIMDRISVEIEPELIEDLHKKGRKLIVRDVVSVKFHEKIDPQKLNDVLQEVSDVVTVYCPENLRWVVDHRVRDVVSVSSKVSELPFINIPFNLSNLLRSVLGHPKKDWSETRSLEVAKYIEVEVEGGTLHLVPGFPEIATTCNDEQFEVYQDDQTLEVEVRGCHTKIHHPPNVNIHAEIIRGVMKVEDLSPSEMRLNIEGGTANVELKDLSDCRFNSQVRVGTLTGSLRFAEGGGDSQLSLEVEGGNVLLLLSLPKEIGVKVQKIEGQANLQVREREGPAGTLMIQVRSRGGYVELREQTE
jgi:DNA-binding transcriptional ArsR family regulator